MGDITNEPVTLGNATASVAAPALTVTYEFDTTATKQWLPLLYAVVINGEVRKEEKEQPKMIEKAPRTLVIQSLKKGDKVALHLNTDAVAGWRKIENRLFEVEVTDHHIVVKVKEAFGTDKTPSSTKDEATKTETHRMWLDGKAWMAASHKYDAKEAEALLTDAAYAKVKDAVKSIYDVLPGNTLEIATPERPKKKLSVKFMSSKNASDNIAGFDTPADGLTRAHPLAYAAIFKAAIDAGVGAMRVESAWRPLKGTINHRAGIGMDVSMLDDIALNRAKLIGADVDADMAANVSDGEEDLLAKYKAARSAEKTAAAAHEAAKKAFAGPSAKMRTAVEKQKKAEAELEKAKEKDKEKRKADLEAATKGVEDLKADHEAAKKTNDDTSAAHATSKAELGKISTAWIEVMAKSANYGVVAKFRDSLASRKPNTILHIFDPWFMDNDATDSVPGTPNTMEEGDPKTHNNHLHITVIEPRIPVH